MGSGPHHRPVIIAGNWKMNHGPQATRHFFEELSRAWPQLSPETQAALQARRLQVWIFPPYVSIAAAIESATKLPIRVGAQNAHWQDSGAYTGEISGPMLSEIGVRHALVGHSERRQYFHETDDTVRKRAETLLAEGFQVLACVGETQTEFEAGETEAVLERQLHALLNKPHAGAAKHVDGQLCIAYEPVWAIGTGLNATPEQAEASQSWIREDLGKRLGEDAASLTPILYGGSVKPDNIAALLACPNVDGVLVGGASIKADSFLDLIEAGGKSLKSRG